MAKFHVNPQTGNPGECSAQAGKCPFGGDAVHYPTRDNAQAAYELSNAALSVPASLSRHMDDPGMEGAPAPLLRSDAVEKHGGYLRVKENVELKVNRWPSCYGDKADRALRHATATMYEYAASGVRTRDQFDAEADRVFGKIAKKYMDDGITDSEPRAYWHDHMDEIYDRNGWARHEY